MNRQSIWKLHILWKLLKASFSRLQQNDPLRMAGATAFFTSFALPPIIVLLFQLFRIFFSGQLIGTQLGKVLSATLGKEGADQLRSTARGFRSLAQNWYMGILGLLFLIFVATTLFKVIRNSLHDIWDIGLKKTGFMFDLKVRGRSLAIILMAGILFLAASIIDVAQVVAKEYIGRIWQTGSVFITGAFNEIASILVTTIWFIILFRYLANARPSWRVAKVGGILTGVLFYIGRTILSSVMSNSNAGIIYGAGAAIVLILLFVFYSSFILYFGACFIKEYSLFINDPIVPSQKAYELKSHPVKQDGLKIE